MADNSKFEFFRNLLKERILVLDGAMGTMLQQHNLDENTFRGDKFKQWKTPLKGCNDILCVSNPEIIRKIHDDYLEAGADIIKTNSFNANSLSLSDYALSENVYEISRAAAQLAKEEADKFTKRCPANPRFIAGSVGPTNRTSSMAIDTDDPSKRETDYKSLVATYKEQIRGLIDGGANIILIETVFDTLNCKAALFAVDEVSEEKGEKIPVMVSVTFSDSSGRTLSGQTIAAFYASVKHAGLLSVGMNCAFGAKKLYPWLRELAEIAEIPVSVHPNAGLPDINGKYNQTPEVFAEDLNNFIEEGLVNIVGGCCGTTPLHIARLTEITRGKKPRRPKSDSHKLTLSNLDKLTIEKESNFINVGERTNVAGSAKFARLIREGNYEEALTIARKQVEAGAQIIDICMDDAMIEGPKAMETFINMIGSEPDISRVPLMIDSSKWDVIEAGLRVNQGKAIVNSISLKEGEKSFLEKALKIKRYGAAVVVMLFDEEGQAVTFDKKIKVAERSYHLLIENGFPPEDIIFDPNILTIGTGIAEHNEYAKSFIEAIEWIKKNLPYAKVSGGVSNLSFAFRGNNRLREAMHSVFLFHAIKAGMDMAIVNPAMLRVYTEIEPELVTLLEDLIFNRRPDATERLLEYVADNKESENDKFEKNPIGDKKSKLIAEERIEEAIIGGKSEDLQADVISVYEKLGNPLTVIDNVLMPAMNKVVSLFGEGKMFLPQVVKSARVMKDAVSFLLPYMKEDEKAVKKGKVVIATVKGDVHDIGKNIVSVVLSCNGFEVKDLGVMVEPEIIAEEAEREEADSVLLSGLITPSLEEMINVCKALGRRGLDLPVIVGGATTSEEHTAVRIAPEYLGLVVRASDASSNAGILNELLSERKDDYIKNLKRAQEEKRESYLREINSKNLSSLKIARENASYKSVKSVSSNLETGTFVLNNVDIDKIEPLINWNFYFNSWGLKGKYPEILVDKKYGPEAVKVYEDALSLLNEIKAKKILTLQGIVGTYPMERKGDDLVVLKDGKRIELPMLRSQSGKDRYPSVADFYAEKGDYVTMFAVTGGVGLKDYISRLKAEGDEYKAIMAKFIADRLTEAFAEYISGIYHGCRMAFGYPAMPDHTLKKEVFEILDVESLTDMRLNNNFMIIPEESICGLIVKDGNYFTVGKIMEDQIEDYASRRHMSVESLKKILPNNI